MVVSNHIMQAAIILSASVTLITLPGLDNLGRIAGFVAILCSTASMISAVMALFRYKADVERTVVYIGGEGLIMLSVCPHFLFLFVSFSDHRL